MARTLPRTLRQRDLVLIVVGTVIGSGIFVVPGPVLRQTGGVVGLALLVWLAGGLLSLLGALTYGELGAMRPEAGGLYVFVREAFGRLPAFLYGWTLFFVTATGSVAALAVASTAYLGEFVALSEAGAKAVAVLMIAAVAAINVLGTRESASVQNWSTAIKVGALLVMSVLLIAGGDGWAEAGDRLLPGDAGAGMLSGVGLAIIAVLWAYEGWQHVTYSVGEALEPHRTFPRAIVAGTVTLIAIYLLANVAYLAALGPGAAATSDRVAAEAVGALLGPGAARLIAAAIVVSMFSAANGLTLTAPRVFYAMAADGVFFRRLAHVHASLGTPVFAVLAFSAWAAVLALSGTFEQLLTYVVFVGWIFYALGAASVFVYRRRQPELPRPFRVPGYPWTPLIFVGTAAAIVLNTVAAQPGLAAVGLGIVALGVPAYLAWRRGEGGGPEGEAEPGFAPGGREEVAPGDGTVGTRERRVDATPDDT